MPVIDIGQLSDDELRRLIAAAMQDYQRRLNAPRAEHSKAADKRPVVSIIVPAEYELHIVHR